MTHRQGQNGALVASAAYLLDNAVAVAEYDVSGNPGQPGGTGMGRVAAGRSGCEACQAAKRNLPRFPEDFMFQLSWEEGHELLSRGLGSRSQSVTLKRGGNIKYRPYAFTEQGVAMLSSVLRSARAVQVNIEIMRAFVRLRRLLATHADLARKMGSLERKMVEHDKQFAIVFDAIRQLREDDADDPPKGQIGFHRE